MHVGDQRQDNSRSISYPHLTGLGRDTGEGSICLFAPAMWRSGSCSTAELLRLEERRSTGTATGTGTGASPGLSNCQLPVPRTESHYDWVDDLKALTGALRHALAACIYILAARYFVVLIPLAWCWRAPSATLLS